jgi:hypothetical protein
MPVLPASALRGLSAKQIAALGLSPKQIASIGGKPTRGRKTQAKAVAKVATRKRPLVANAFRLHVPRVLPDSVSVTTQPTVVTLKIGGVPENWSNSRYGKAVHQKQYSGPWHRAASLIAKQALNQAKLAPQEAPHPQRRVEIMIFRCAPMFDPDAIAHTMKPVIDGLKRLLIYDDSLTYLDLDVEQTRIYKRIEQYIQITIFDLDLA